MKRFLFTALAATAIALITMVVVQSYRHTADKNPAHAPEVETRVQAEVVEPAVSQRIAAVPEEPAPTRDETPSASNTILQSRSTSRSTSQIIARQALDTLVLPTSTYSERQDAFGQLWNLGLLDHGISELEQRTATDSNSAQSISALGRLYLMKCGSIQDVREQGILGMKADQVFDAALKLDADNWEARFNKAVGLSYWPKEMNRGQEVMQHFSTLIEQQETQAPQPHFAQTYLLLGSQYEKHGHSAEAQAMWQRGASLFPNDAELRKKLVK